MNLILIFLLLSHFDSSPSLFTVREMHDKAYSNSFDASFFFDYMNKLDVSDNAVFTAYKGTSYIFMASHGWNPMTKYSNFKTGSAMLDKAVLVDEENIELRYLRYSIQSKAPAFLGYREHLETDKEIIKDKWSATSDVDLKRRIANFMASDENISPEEKKIFLDYRQNSAMTNRKY